MNRARVGLVLASLLAAAAGRDAAAHPLAPALLQIRETGGGRAEMTWRPPAHVTADGRVAEGMLRASDPVLLVPERPRRLDVFRDYCRLGVEHILTRPDHLLFSFNVGIELGQVLFVLAVLGAQRLLARRIARLPAWARRVPL